MRTLKRKGYIQILGASLFLPCLLFLSIPNGLLLSNLEEIPHDWTISRYLFLFFFVTFVFSAPIFFIAQRIRMLHWVPRCIIVLGLNLLMWDVLSFTFSNGQLPWVGFLGIELVLLLITGVIIFRVRMSLLLQLFGFIGFILFLNGIWAHYFSIVNPTTSFSTFIDSFYVKDSFFSSKKQVANKDLIGLTKFKGNIYHIIFDVYQSEAYPSLLSKSPDLENIPFEYFPNFRSNSGRTWISNAELFSGKFYSPELTTKEWYVGAYQNGLLSKLIETGFALNLYPFYTYYCNQNAQNCLSGVNFKKEYFGLKLSYDVFADLWFQKILPNFLREILNSYSFDKINGQVDNAGWDYGFSITRFFRGNEVGDSVPINADNPFFSVQQFKQMLKEEGSREPIGQYVLAHLILPHGPYSVNKDCAYIGKSKRKQPSLTLYLEQVECAHKLIGLLTDKLKALHRFEESLIIVHSDHGMFWHPNYLYQMGKRKPLTFKPIPEISFDQDDSSKWPSEVIETRSSALLLIKWPKAKEPSINLKPIQTIDIAPTLIENVGGRLTGFAGFPIQDLNEFPNERTMTFTAQNAKPVNGNPKYMSLYRKIVGGEWIYKKHIQTKN